MNAIKNKVALLSVLLLLPTASAVTVQRQNLAPRVTSAKGTSKTPYTTLTRPTSRQALSDEELDQVSGKGLVVTAAIGAAGNAGYEIGRQLIVNKGVTSWKAVGEAAVVGGVVGAGGGVIGAVGKGAQVVARPAAQAAKNIGNTVSSFVIGTAAGTTHATVQKR